MLKHSCKACRDSNKVISRKRQSCFATLSIQLLGILHLCINGCASRAIRLLIKSEKRPSERFESIESLWGPHPVPIWRGRAWPPAGDRWPLDPRNPIWPPLPRGLKLYRSLFRVTRLCCVCPFNRLFHFHLGTPPYDKMLLKQPPCYIYFFCFHFPALLESVSTSDT